MRTCKLLDPPFSGLSITCKNDKDCIFCKHCTCFWDYTNGPYMFICDLERSECSEAETVEEHTCEMFEDSEEENDGV